VPVHVSIVLPHSFFKEKDYLKEINSGKKIFSKMKFQVQRTLYKIIEKLKNPEAVFRARK
jgi:hypothetical protein